MSHKSRSRQLVLVARMLNFVGTKQPLIRACFINEKKERWQCEYSGECVHNVFALILT